MPESTSAASILIATSWQAYTRGKTGDEDTEICNSIVVIVFAAFFIEANLNYIIREIDPENSGNGLQAKLLWFCQAHISSSMTEEEVSAEFPGYLNIRRFRNEIAHGKIDHTLTNMRDAERLRSQAKAMVDKLFGIAEKSYGRKLERLTTYRMAIESAKATKGLEPNDRQGSSPPPIG